MNTRWKMPFPGVAVLMIVFVASCLPAKARADVLNFEELSGNHLAIPNGYGGLDWVNFSLLVDPGPAYSDPNSTLGSFFFRDPVISSSTPFDLDGMRITSPSGNLTLEVHAYRNGSRVYRSSWLYPNQFGHIRPSPNLTNIDRVEFIRVGGADYFAMDDFTFVAHSTYSDPIYDNFHHGATLEDRGYIIATANPTGVAEIIDDPWNTGNGVMRLFDSANGQVAVSATKRAALPLPSVTVEFEFRFLTEGKLNVLLDGVLVDTIPSPVSGDGSPGNPNMAHYDQVFNTVAAGLTPGEMDLTFELVNQGDPELHLDNLHVTNAIPEPTTLSLLAIGVLAVGRLALPNRDANGGCSTP